MPDKFSHTWEQAVQWLIDQPEKKELVRYCYYDDPLVEAAERFRASEEWKAVMELLDEYLPGRVLDLGAGRGISSYAFAKEKCSVVALEPDPSPLVGYEAIKSLAKASGTSIQVDTVHGEALPFDDNSFDIVYGRAVLHHAKDLKMLCKEAFRVLRRGGVFLATREHVISRKEDLSVFLDSHPLHHLYGGENAYLLKEYISAISMSGAKLKKVMGPYENVINYAPMTKERFIKLVSDTLARRLGGTIASAISSWPQVQKLFGWYLSRNTFTPGRHYSFLAIKI